MRHGMGIDYKSRSDAWQPDEGVLNGKTREVTLKTQLNVTSCSLRSLFFGFNKPSATWAANKAIVVGHNHIAVSINSGVKSIVHQVFKRIPWSDDVEVVDESEHRGTSANHRGCLRSEPYASVVRSGNQRRPGYILWHKLSFRRRDFVVSGLDKQNVKLAGKLDHVLGRPVLITIDRNGRAERD
jgi:hypothetical protein